MVDSIATPPSRLAADAILELKPQDMGNVEPELAVSLPRSQEWFGRNGGSFTDEKLETWQAIRGWVCQCISTHDYEGPDYHIVVAWLADDTLHQKYFKIGYDFMHWAGGSPEHYKWFFQTIKPGNPLTLLISPTDANDCKMFGQCEAFARRNGELVWAAS